MLVHSLGLFILLDQCKPWAFLAEKKCTEKEFLWFCQGFQKFTWGVTVTLQNTRDSSKSLKKTSVTVLRAHVASRGVCEEPEIRALQFLPELML